MILVISCSIIYYAEPTGRDELSVAHSDFESLVSHIGLNAQILRSKASYTGSQPSTKSCCSPCRTRELHLFPIKDLTVLCTPLEIFVLIWRKWSWSLSHCISMAKKKKKKKDHFYKWVTEQIFASPFLWQTYTQACTQIHIPLCWRCMKAVCCTDSLTSHMQITFPHAALWLACCY